MADSDYEFQQGTTWIGIWNRVQSVFRLFMDMTGFYFEDETGSQAIRARLKVDDTTTKFEMLSKDGVHKFTLDLENNSVKVLDTGTNLATEITTAGINYYDSSSIKRRVDTFQHITFYDTNGTTALCDLGPSGLVIYDSDGTVRATITKDICKVLNDATNWLGFSASGLTLKVNNVTRFNFGDTGMCAGSNGTYSWSLDPAALSANAAFNAKAECDSSGNSAGNKNYLAEA